MTDDDKPLGAWIRELTSRAEAAEAKVARLRKALAAIIDAADMVGDVMDWQPMETAPLNPYGKAFGPVVMICCDGDNYCWPAYFDPNYQWKYRDIGPAWVIPDQEPPIAPENAIGWAPMPLPPETKGGAK